MVRVGLAAVLIVMLVGGTAAASDGFVHGYCEGDRPVVTERPPGMEDEEVYCKDGWFTVSKDLLFVGRGFNDLNTARYPKPPQSDFGGWVTVRLNGVMILPPYTPQAERSEPYPFLVVSSRRVLMPIRFFTEALGGEVEWNPANSQVTLRWRELTVLLTVGQPTALVNGRQVALDQPPLIHDMRTFVPLRFVLETFGATVQWNQADYVADIIMPGVRCANPTYCGNPS